ncbi:hypothetical protein HY78_18750 [Rhizorhabdus wittichii DC-6]|nr:hypothetical protein HY78_18750 [Rhizorhabdus wittichii DC-6]
MADIVTIKVEGLRELDEALKELPKSARKPVLRRIARKALIPFLAAVKAKAPVDDPADTPKRPAGALRDSYTIGSTLNRSQRRTVKREGKSDVEVYAGTNDRVGILQEFGTVNHAARPHGRPAWDETKDEALAIVQTELGGEIEKTAARAARKAARLAIKNGG